MLLQHVSLELLKQSPILRTIKLGWGCGFSDLHIDAVGEEVQVGRDDSPCVFS